RTLHAHTRSAPSPASGRGDTPSTRPDCRSSNERLDSRLMTKLLEQALEAVRRLPPDSQDEIARAIPQFSARGGEPGHLDAAPLPAVVRGLAHAKRPQFRSDGEVHAGFRRLDG